MLEANEKSKKEDILKLAEGHILQKAELRGRYQRKHREDSIHRMKGK